MIQNIICIVLVALSFLYLLNKYFIKSKKSLLSKKDSPKSSSCGCGSVCPLQKE